MENSTYDTTQGHFNLTVKLTPSLSVILLLTTLFFPSLPGATESSNPDSSHENSEQYNTLDSANGHNNIYTLPLKHRRAESIIPMLRPLLDEGTSFSPRGQALIVKTTSDKWPQIQTLVDELDRPLARLRITVAKKSYPSLENKTTKSTLPIRTQEIQSIEVVEGSNVYLSSEPALSSLTVYGLHRNHIIETELPTGRPLGFYLSPQLRGEQAIIDVIARFNEQGKILEVGTTLIGNLGDWLSISRNERFPSARNHQLDTRSIRGEKGLFVMVEKL